MTSQMFLFLATCFMLVVTYALGYRRGVKDTIAHYESVCKDWENYCNEMHTNWKQYCENLATEYKKFINDVCEYDYFDLNKKDDIDEFDD